MKAPVYIQFHPALDQPGERELPYVYLSLFAPKTNAAFVQIYIQNHLPQHLLTMRRKAHTAELLSELLQIKLYCESAVNVSVGHLRPIVCMLQSCKYASAHIA